jgi:hypothetical protein
MKTDDFEKRLQRQVPRQIPAAWREKILTNAQSTSTSPNAPSTTHHGLRSLIHQFTTLLRPQRVAWCGIVAAWLLIFSLNHSVKSEPTLAAASQPRPSAEALQALKQQRLLFAELSDKKVLSELERTKASPSGPRSQRREETATV